MDKREKKEQCPTVAKPTLQQKPKGHLHMAAMTVCITPQQLSQVGMIWLRMPLACRLKTTSLDTDTCRTAAGCFLCVMQ